MIKNKGIYKRNNTWWVSYTVDSRQIRESTKSTHLKVAKELLAERLIEIAEGRFLDISKRKKIKFDVFVDEYLESHSKNNKTYRNDVNNAKVLKRFFGGKYLHEITSMDVDQFKKERAQQVSFATTNRALALLRSIFNRAIEAKKAEDNPVRKVKLFKENNKRIVYLTQDEINRLIEKAAEHTEHLKPILIVAIHTGLRKSEILNLRWQDIDIEQNIIYLRDTKSGERQEVPMNDTVKKTLIAVPKLKESDYIFCKKDGRPYKDVRKSFFTAVKNAGIIKNSGFRFHDTRHTFGSHLVMSGLDLNTVRELLRHKSIQMTLRYAHLSPDHKKKAVNILDKRLAIDNHEISKKFITNLSQSPIRGQETQSLISDNSLELQKI